MVRLDLTDLVRRETERTASAAPAAVRVLSVGGDTPIWVMGDEVRLSEVLRNLLSNAMRHTKEGSIQTVVETGLDGRVEVLVHDTGAGISPDDIPNIFERFYRTDATRAADTGGAGLGLAIARRIVEDHAGEVFAQSELGVGSVVGFWLPPAPDVDRAHSDR